MDTKSRGDIGEQAVVLKALTLGWAVLRPIGDRLPYDLVLDIQGKLVKIQVKVAWKNGEGSYSCDTRRTKTNRRQMIRDRYVEGDFQFAIVYVTETNQFYVFPVEIFNSYKSNITLPSRDKGRAKSRRYLEAWHLIESLN